ncbi:MAG: Xaa-Pro peptidase family protein [Gemmatimonadaceae bacterium]|jgi:Xaa-Pro dipeptidase|nr:Xaa-Pro peptidase family protein [Gemmatimonadaceae bacterium]
MSNRRDFLSAAALTTTGLALGARAAHAAPDEQPRDLPPAIKALRPMRDGVVPISVAERRARIEKAREIMRREGLDALVLTGGTSMEYFTGIRWGVSERLLAAIIPVKGSAFLVTPKFEETRALEQAHEGPLGTDAQVYAWEEDEDPYALVAKGLRDRGLATATVGAEETTRFVFGAGMAQAMPQAKFASGTPVTAGCRMIKDAHELALMKHASAVTLAAYEAAWKSLADGMTQADFQELIRQAHRQLGYDGSASCQVGEFSAMPHGSAKPQVVREGTIVLIDGGCKVEGYVSDISRTFVLGKATQRMKDVFEIEHRAQSAALAAARPGVPCEAVDAAARKVIVDAGFGPDYKYFTHRVGHGMGMDGHEWPYLVRGNTLPLAAGMTFSDEPGIYIPGEFGIRLEDDMIITESGAVLMTPQSPSLETPFRVA